MPHIFRMHAVPEPRAKWIKTVKSTGPRLRAKQGARKQVQHQPDECSSVGADSPTQTGVERFESSRPDNWITRNNSDLSATTNTTEYSQDLLNDTECQWLQTIYEDCFEAIFGSWMGAHACPFLFRQRETFDISVSISRLCRQLDAWLNEDDSSTPLPDDTDLQIEQCLTHAIQSFAVRWLPLISPKPPHVSPLGDKFEHLWRRSRREMLRVINRPSYRSMLTLLLFGLTPVPAGVSEEEELDGISGQVAVQSAFHQVQSLRARQRILRFNGAKVSPILTVKSFSPKDETTAAAIINTENTVLWAALTFDTSASLTLCSRPMLSAGLFGIESEASWRLVRSCRKIFHEAAEEWRQPGFELTDFKANQVIAAGSTWKLLVWKMTAIFKEAIGDGHDEIEVARALSAVTEAITQWNCTFRDLLTACQKRIHFLNQETKLRWYELMLHYHLAILLSVDIVDATERFDLLPQLIAHRNEAESWVLNCLDFGLNNTFTLRVRRRSVKNFSESEVSSVTVPIISIDPYAHHVVAGVQLLRKAIRRDYTCNKISEGVCNNLLITLKRALQHLPSGSKSVQVARADLESEIMT
ncbi:hypothetical protein M433DRAFT_579 [Acidomyces richmondensis BFW]|nr:hypothetical protein M433DRAFT_579 [Acidomyces richmondensis BFW]